MATASPIIQSLRNFLAGKNIQSKLHLRYSPECSPRSIPEPNIPDGVSHRLSANHYCNRDGRRESKPATLVYTTTKRLAEQSGESGTPAVRSVVTPGSRRTYKLSTDEPYLM